MSPYLSLIIPCYNEAQHLEKSFPKVIAVLKKSKLSFEVIIIDDCSQDNTVDIIYKLIRNNREISIRLIKHEKNIGRGGTVTEGIIQALGEVVGFIDIDLEVGPSYILHFVKLIKNNTADIVTGRRFYPVQFFNLQYFTRTILSIGYSLIVKLMLGMPVKDTGTGYKFFKRENILPVLSKVKDRHWFWDTEIVIRSILHGLRVQEEQVCSIRNKEKKSTVRIIPDVIRYLKALFSFKLSLFKEGTHFGKLYHSPFLYTLTMKALFGKNYGIRYLSIAKLIEPKSTVADVCCGDCVLYEYLRDKKIEYLGLDISSSFIARALRNGIRARLFDLRKDNIPSSDYIILQGSLYQFKNPQLIVEKLYKAFRKKLIISETVINASAHRVSKKPFMRKIISMFVGTENNDELFRFDEDSFRALLNTYKPSYIKAGKDLIAVIGKRKYNEK